MSRVVINRTQKVIQRIDILKCIRESHTLVVTTRRVANKRSIALKAILEKDQKKAKRIGRLGSHWILMLT